MTRAGAKALLAGAALALSAAAFAQDQQRLPPWWPYPLKAFTHSSESMLPAIRPISYLIAHKRPVSELRRGDVIVFQKGRDTWVMRLAGLPGDRIEIVGGRVRLNGRLATYGEATAYDSLLDPLGDPVEGVERRSEQLEGEAEPHFILDQGHSLLDDVPETLVAADRVFVLGDNRDDAADSRIPTTGQIALADVYGVVQPKYIRWLRAPEPLRPAAPGSPGVTVVPSTPPKPE